MAEPAKWIKITTNMFEDEKIEYIQSLPEGDALLVIWIRLIAMAGRSNAGGYILLQEDIPYTEDMLANKFKRTTQLINYALATFEKFKMIEMSGKGILITNFNKHQDLDKLNKKREQDRIRQQRKREREKLLLEAAKGELGAEKTEVSRVTSRDSMRDNECDFSRDSSSSSSYIYNNTIYNNSKNHAKNDNYINFFENNFHMIAPHEMQILKSFEEDGIEPAAIVFALQEAIENAARDIRYVSKILNSWMDKGIRTLEQAMADKAEFERNKNKNNQPKQASEVNSWKRAKTFD